VHDLVLLPCPAKLGDAIDVEAKIYRRLPTGHLR